MSNIPIDDGLAKTFAEAGSSIRAILVQNDGGYLKLVDTAPPSTPDSTDKDDFLPILAKLFGNDPQRSGYVLYRLNTQSASGEWEWICCSYQPDGAKIKEKMQYAITRSSLMAGLTERRFLETIFGASPHEFHWPTKLRNSRKHDYQNPQIKAGGKSPAEAAGMGVGDARRNFGAVKTSTSSSEGKVTPSSRPAETSSEVAVAEERPPPVPESEQPTVSSLPVPKRYNSHEFTSAFKNPSPPFSEREEQERSGQQLQDDDTISKDAANEEQFQSETKAPEEPPTPAMADTSSATLSQPTVPAESTLSTVEESRSGKATPQTPAQASHTAVGTGTNQEPPTPSQPDSAYSQPTVPASLDDSDVKSKTGPTSTVGLGTGASASGLTQREEELAELRKLQASERATSLGAGPAASGGGPAMGFRWADGVQEAIQGLASTASGTSEWNLVVLSIDLRNESIELDVPPRFVPAADLISNLSENEPRIAFYRVDDAGALSSKESVVAMLYCCPASSGVKARMVYSSNVLTILNHVKGFSGMRVVKKVSGDGCSQHIH